MTRPNVPQWFGEWHRHFRYKQDGDLIVLVCRRCGDHLGFTGFATENTILHEARRHVYGPEIPPTAPECRGG